MLASFFLVSIFLRTCTLSLAPKQLQISKSIVQTASERREAKQIVWCNENNNKETENDYANHSYRSPER